MSIVQAELEAQRPVQREPYITIDDQVLTTAQAMAVRVAVTAFHSEVHSQEGREALGPIADGYAARLDELLTIMLRERPHRARRFTSVLQPWTLNITLMQQSVLLTAIRGPDTLPKYHPAKNVLRWFRRCVLVAALEDTILATPYDPRGGSFCGPSIKPVSTPDSWGPDMDRVVDIYMQQLDAVPMHFHMHLMHAAEILGYKHPITSTRAWWYMLYLRFVAAMHLKPETEHEMDERLGDNRDAWLARADKATTA